VDVARSWVEEEEEIGGRVERDVAKGDAPVIGA